MDTSFSSASDMKCLYQLFTITEELLFSIPLNPDLVEKYLILRESGLKKVGLFTNNTGLWDLQKQAHLEISQKHSAQEKHIKELATSLDLSRHSFKELYDISHKVIEYLKDSAIETAKSLGKAPQIKISKESLHLSLQSNQSQMISCLISDFNLLKDEFKNLLQESFDKIRFETKQNIENKAQIVKLAEESSKKAKEFQQKLENVEEEAKLKYDAALIECRRNLAIELDELKSTFKIQEARKSKEIQEIRENYEKEIRMLEEDKNYAIENLSCSIKTSHKQELKELELSFRAKECELLEELDMATNTDSTVLQTLRDNLERMQIKVQDLREVLRAITERVSSLFQKYAFKEDLVTEFSIRREEISKISQNKAWQQYSELLAQLDFMGLSFKKLASDNEWLVEQIDELSRENELAKEYSCHNKYAQEAQYESKKDLKELNYDQVLNTLSANEIVIKDFQDARSKLLKQFADAKKN